MFDKKLCFYGIIEMKIKLKFKIIILQFWSKIFIYLCGINRTSEIMLAGGASPTFILSVGLNVTNIRGKIWSRNKSIQVFHSIIQDNRPILLN